MPPSEQEQNNSETPEEIAEVKQEVEEKLEEIEEEIEQAETQDDIDAIELKIEGLKTWLTEQIANPLTTLQTEMAALSKAITKSQKKAAVVTEQPEQPEVVPPPEVEPKVPAQPAPRVTRL